MTPAPARTAAAGARLRTALLESQRRVLERIASGAPLEEVLETLVRLIEEQAGDMRCAVLLTDAGQKRLRFIAAPNVPQDYQLGMEPYLRIAPDMGSCGTAAYLRQPVYTRDAATDPRWQKLRHIALRNGLRAIWSTPILSDENVVLGTFAMYYGEPRLPSAEHMQLIDMATQMARVAIEAKSDDEILRTVFEGAPDGMLITDLDGTIVRANRAFAAMLGHAPGELHGSAVSEITGADFGAWMRELRACEQGSVTTDRRYQGKGGAITLAREHSTLRRDAAGTPRYVLSHVERIGDAQGDGLQRLSAREREVLQLVIAGNTSKKIAARLGIAAASVDTYRSRIMLKLGIDDLPSLVRFAIRRGIARL